MSIKPIKTKKDYKAAIEKLESIFDAKPGSPQGDELEILEFLLTIMKKFITQLTIRIPLRQLNSEWSKWVILKMISPTS